MIAVTAGCADYPDDIAGTSDRIHATRIIRVGIVASGPGELDAPAIDTYLSRIENRTGARRSIDVAAAEPLFARIEHGDLDIVIGEFADDSPWLAEVAFVDPLARRSVPQRMISLVPVARNGEYRWIMLLEKAVRERRGA